MNDERKWPKPEHWKIPVFNEYEKKEGIIRIPLADSLMMCQEELKVKVPERWLRFASVVPGSCNLLASNGIVRTQCIYAGETPKHTKLKSIFKTKQRRGGGEGRERREKWLE